MSNIESWKWRVEEAYRAYLGEQINLQVFDIGPPGAPNAARLLHPEGVQAVSRKVEISTRITI